MTIRRTHLVELAVVFLILTIGVAVLLWGLPVYDPSRVHYNMLRGGFNDQLGYVTMARELADTGALRSHITLTSALWRQPDGAQHRIYMPGHYVALALSYRVLGYGVWQSFVPGMLGFLMGGLGAYVLTRAQRASRTAGLSATLLFFGFPSSLLFSASAMADMTCTLIAAIGLCGFALAPHRLRLFLGPPLILLCYLLRETGALVCLPMAALVYATDDGARRGWRRRLRPVLALLIAAAVLCGAAGQLPVIKNRVNTNPGFLLEREEQVRYNDAVRQQELAATASSGQYLRATARLFAQNVAEVAQRLTGSDAELVASVSTSELFDTLLVIAVALACVVTGLRGSPLALGTGVALLVLILLMAATYQLVHYKLLRISLFLLPAALAGLCAAARRAFAGRARILCVAAAAATLWYSHVELERAYGARLLSDLIDVRCRRFLEDLRHDDRTMLVAPFHVLGDYPARHYPVNVAFLPANVGTLRMLMARHRVGTIVLPPPEPGRTLTAAEVIGEGFVLIGTRRHFYTGEVMQILRHRDLQPQPLPPAK